MYKTLSLVTDFPVVSPSLQAIQEEVRGITASFQNDPKYQYLHKQRVGIQKILDFLPSLEKMYKLRTPEIARAYFAQFAEEESVRKILDFVVLDEIHNGVQLLSCLESFKGLLESLYKQLSKHLGDFLLDYAHRQIALALVDSNLTIDNLKLNMDIPLDLEKNKLQGFCKITLWKLMELTGLKRSEVAKALVDQNNYRLKIERDQAEFSKKLETCKAFIADFGQHDLKPESEAGVLVPNKEIINISREQYKELNPETQQLVKIELFKFLPRQFTNPKGSGSTPIYTSKWISGLTVKKEGGKTSQVKRKDDFKQWVSENSSEEDQKINFIKALLKLEELNVISVVHFASGDQGMKSKPEPPSFQYQLPSSDYTEEVPTFKDEIEQFIPPRENSILPQILTMQNIGHRSIIQSMLSIATGMPPELLKQLINQIPNINTTVETGQGGKKTLIQYFFSETLFGSPQESFTIIEWFLANPELEITKKMINEIVTSERSFGFNILSSLCLLGIRYERPEILDYLLLIIEQNQKAVIPKKANQERVDTHRLVKSTTEFHTQVKNEDLEKELRECFKNFLDALANKEKASEYSVESQSKFLGVMMSFMHITVVRALIAQNIETIIQRVHPKAIAAVSVFKDAKEHMHMINYLVSNNDLESLKKVKERCEKEGVNFSEIINTPDRYGNTPIHIASNAGFDEIIQFLIENNINTSCKNNNGETPLHLAAKSGKMVTIEILTTHSRELATLRDHAGNTPIMMLIKHSGSDQIIKFYRLVEKLGGIQAVMAILDIANSAGALPIHLVAEKGLSIAFEDLAIRYVQGNKLDKHQRSVAHYFIEGGQDFLMMECYKRQVVRREEVEQIDDQGVTPVLLAFKKGYFRTADTLCNLSNFTFQCNFLHEVIKLRDLTALKVAIQILERKFSSFLGNLNKTAVRSLLVFKGETAISIAKAMKFEGGVMLLEELHQKTI